MVPDPASPERGHASAVRVAIHGPETDVIQVEFLGAVPLVLENRGTRVWIARNVRGVGELMIARADGCVTSLSSPDVVVHPSPHCCGRYVSAFQASVPLAIPSPVLQKAFAVAGTRSSEAV